MISNTTTKQEFAADGIQTVFPFTISFIAGTINSVIKVYVDGVLQEAGFTLAQGSVSDGIALGGEVTFAAAPADESDILIQRESARVQPVDYPANYSNTVSEQSADRIILQVQELSEQVEPITAGEISALLKLPDWEVDKEYCKDQVVYVTGEQPQFNDKIYRAVAPDELADPPVLCHTSFSFATDFGNGLWQEIVIRGITGPQGDKGDKGDKGDTGAMGPQGPNGAQGADGIFSEIASQAEAQAGTDNEKGMTPLRTKNAIDSQVPNLTVITQLQSDVEEQESITDGHETRINQLEAISPKDLARGRQRIVNNQETPISLLGAAAVGENGSGNKFELNEAGARSARIEFEIYRKSDTEMRFVTGVLRMQYVDGLWYLGRDFTTVLAGTAPDGLTFSVDNSTPGVGVVQYESDEMGGVYDVGESYMLWFIREIQKNF